jgi:hypothetical protein
VSIGSGFARDGAQATAEELKAFVKQRVAAYKHPSVISLVGDLPNGPTGKVLKREIRLGGPGRPPLTAALRRSRKRTGVTAIMPRPQHATPPPDSTAQLCPVPRAAPASHGAPAGAPSLVPRELPYRDAHQRQAQQQHHAELEHRR